MPVLSVRGFVIICDPCDRNKCVLAKREPLIWMKILPRSVCISLGAFRAAALTSKPALLLPMP